MKNNDGNREVSKYDDSLASPMLIYQSTNRLKAAFPKMSDQFFNLLSERIIANDFTENRLIDAINHVIDNFAYKELNISDVIRFDRKVKLYTYPEVSDLVTAGKASFSDFEIREIDGKTFRVKKSDLI
ncbi:hypothetical protein [Proteiniphilum acetatigenes]|uniref:hypothetical protein n=1 Tax=Proteiniphilum acetatigenes TaxID=294710 RepID=UPI000361ACA7|nr:hypothetical protein [Proteiniphilum acetatigenes]